MKAITQAVLENKADLGIIFDTDVDRYFNHPNLSNHIAHSCISSFQCKIVSCRSAAVDSIGREFNRNRLIALMSAIVLEEVRASYLSCLKCYCFNIQLVSISLFPAKFIINLARCVFHLASGNNHCYRQCDFRWPDNIY